MKNRMKDFPLTLEEVRMLMRKEESKKCAWFVIGTSVIAVLIALIIWVAKKREKDLEEHYEYFDDDFDELDENFDEFDESIYDDEEEQIEYVKIKDFMNDEEAVTEELQELEETEETNEVEK